MTIDTLVIHKGRTGAQNGTKRSPNFDGCRAHHHVDIFEYLARGDAAAAIGRFDQVVTCLAAMFTAKCIDEREGLAELLCLDQEASAIDVPSGGQFPHVVFTPGGGKIKTRVWIGRNFIEGETESTRERGRGQFHKIGATATFPQEMQKGMTKSNLNH
jgi:hypothetical protein